MASPINPLEGAFFDLTARTKIRVTGEDRHRYLNGQITNDLRKVTEANAIASCILNAKGKMDAHVFVSSEAGGFVLDANVDLRAVLPPRLERYVIADDVQLEDVTERLSILHVIGARVLELAVPAKIISANRFGAPGHDVWTDALNHDEIFRQLEATIPFCDQDRAEIFRIEQGVPRWGRELTGEILPR